MMAIAVSITLNSQIRSFHVLPTAILADVLRDECGLTGCKVGCDQSVCGTCTVLVDGKPTAACSTFMFSVDGAEVTTIEGLAAGGVLHPVQQAFLDCHAFQCGFCASGMILSIVALLREDLDPSDDTIRRWLAGNLCRCTGYEPIVTAVRRAALRLQSEPA